MPQDYRLYLGVILTGGLIVFGVSFFPALTTGGSGSATSSFGPQYEAVFRAELDCCRENADDVNCRCFANISGIIQADTRPRVPGAVYADKQELARWQAAKSC
ncbi:MAG: hypothetical protein QNJ09_03830 [Paracoccaceae bacterium]|nr:hypothetical protein [Paracoccaceae bacterium]